MEYESAFLIRKQDQIIRKLSILLKNKCLITGYYGDNDNSFITTLFDINEKNKFIIFYHSPRKDLIKNFINSPVITFKTEHIGIKISFESVKVEKIQHQGVSAFTVPIPDSLLWVEAREFYRVKFPVLTPSFCQLTINNQASINLKLYDLSISGLSVISDSSEISDLMITDARFEQCKLILTDEDEGIISFEIRSKYTINKNTTDRVEKIGCKLTSITSAFENTIQRYMQKIEIENRKK